ncbi:fibronectin type III domain-containing protein [Paenibacillus sepulcri]|uniref:Fibronectin type-III domain-containing protein n=1 Tax=Paenibacillus sepulcri TaxID=359917 RepID=A0ABS7BWF0_9BACL|nr:hypothetical protein [Paenibacillus sepulcri]
MKTNQLLKPMLVMALAAILAVMSITSGFAGKPAAAAGSGMIYYVDSAAGNNSSSGTDKNSPWKTLSHVSESASLFRPGDQILLKAGSVWNESFDVTFSGSDDNGITIGKYGGDIKPVINGGGGNYAVRIQNQQNVTVQDIEITNFNANDYDDYKTDYYRRSGVWVQAYHNGPMNNIRLVGLDIHDITGISVTGESWVEDTDGESVNKNFNAAIMVNAWEWDANVPADKHGYYKNFTVENCNIHDIKTIGINMDGYMNDPDTYHKNVVIRGNTINKTGSDGIIIGVANNPLIEHNSVYDVAIDSVDGKWIAGVWVWKTIGATIQYNEVARVHYQNSSNTDSNAFDVDIQAQGNHLFQYNYSHDNAGGFTMDMGQLQNGTTTYRYNISQNDAHHGFTGNTLNISDPTLFYNNVMYNDNGDGIVIKDNSKASFINNIFYTSKGNAPYPAGPKFYNNDFYGSAPPSQGVNNLTVDPKFADPGKSGDGMAIAAGYKLRADSPLIGAGKAIEGNGGKDFQGNPLYTGSPDIGAFEDPNSTISDTAAPAKPSGLAAADKSDTAITLSWDSLENNVPLDGDIYDASTGKKVASVMMSNTAELTGLTPDTSYAFYVVSKDMLGNASAASDPLTVKTTIPAVIVDNAEASLTGAWVPGTANASYQNDYVTIAKGSGSNTAAWTPELAKDGYYSVYYQLPNGSASRASNAPFTVNFDGGSKTYAVNERLPGGSWVLLGIHKFKAGTTGNVRLSDKANGEVAADAVKFLFNDEFGTDSITRVALTTDKLQLKIGETMGLSVKGMNGAGKALDLISEGMAVQFTSDNAAVSISGDGVITGVSQGTATIGASVTINGVAFTSNHVKVIVGPGFSVQEPSITDSSGLPLASFSSFGLVTASTFAVNSTDIQQNVTLIMAVYNRKGLVKTSMQNAVIKSYDNTELNISLVMPEDVSGCYLKVFVWDGKDEMHPLAARTIYPDSLN